MSCKTLDEANGEQNARFVLIGTDAAVVFTFTTFALFSLCVVKVEMKLECLEGPCPGSDRPSLPSPLPE